MKKIIKENWFKIVVLLILVGLFYWYEYRPSEIKKQCNKESVEKAKNIEDGNQAIKIYDARYKSCLRENGL
ncbi:MAG: hypothetical protein KAT05_09575 [Spirochaetes bacterium]|nr:hypothetical protein [Spirochaetota bacterium]